MNNDVKNMLQSKTVIGSLVALTATGAQMAGWDIGNPELYVNDLLAITGAVLAIYGRLTATKRVKVL